MAHAHALEALSGSRDIRETQGMRDPLRSSRLPVHSSGQRGTQPRNGRRSGPGKPHPPASGPSSIIRDNDGASATDFDQRRKRAPASAFFRRRSKRRSRILFATYPSGRVFGAGGAEFCRPPSVSVGTTHLDSLSSSYMG
jgi:hypothetical protein